MAVQEQVFGFFIPTVTLMGVGAHKELPNQVKTLGAKKPLIVTDKGITGAGITEQLVTLLKMPVLNVRYLMRPSRTPQIRTYMTALMFIILRDVTPSSLWAAAAPMTVVRVLASLQPTAAKSTITRVLTSLPRPCLLLSPLTPPLVPPVK
jgi:hypothetical protein